MKKEILYIREGLELHPDPNNPKRKLVTWTDLHEEGLDTSLKTNPISWQTPYEYNGIKIPVISIFKRKGSSKLPDGNPALYALKKEKGYQFSSKTNEDNFIKRFNAILNKLCNNMHKDMAVILPDSNYHRIPNVLVPVPSTNKLNTLITTSIKKNFPDIEVVNKALYKLTYGEILTLLDDEINRDELWDNFYELGVNPNEIYDMIDSIEDIFLDIDPTLESLYQQHKIKDKIIRKVITATMSGNMKYKDNLYGKDIMVVDDSITYGASIKESLDILYTMYRPKSVIIVTMFSKLFKD